MQSVAVPTERIDGLYFQRLTTSYKNLNSTLNYLLNMNEAEDCMLFTELYNPREAKIIAN